MTKQVEVARNMGSTIAVRKSVPEGVRFGGGYDVKADRILSKSLFADVPRRHVQSRTSEIAVPQVSIVENPQDNETGSS